MSFVTFVRDYIQDPDKIVHIPSFIFDACREFFWYVFSFQWLRNLTYVTLSLAYPEGLSSDSATYYPSLLEKVAKMQNNGVVQQSASIFLPDCAPPISLEKLTSDHPLGTQVTGASLGTSLSTMVGDFLASSGLPISISDSVPSDYVLKNQSFSPATLSHLSSEVESNIIAPFLLRTQEGFSFLHNLQEKYTSTALHGGAGNAGDALAHELNHSQFSTGGLLANSAYGFFNGITSNFHFCAITIVIAHIILNENKNRAFKIASISCTADLSYMVAVFLGFRGLIIPWFAIEPLGYFLGFAIQFYFALEIIKDNRRIKSFDSKSNDGKKSIAGSKSLGRLSYNYWLIPSIVLFSWCEQTQFFQTLASNGFQPTATLMGLPFVASSDGTNSFSVWQGGANLSTVLGAFSPLLPYGSELSKSSSVGLPLAKERDLQILIYLLTYITTRIVFTWFGLTIFQKVIDWKNNNYFRPFSFLPYGSYPFAFAFAFAKGDSDRDSDALAPAPTRARAQGARAQAQAQAQAQARVTSWISKFTNAISALARGNGSKFSAKVTSGDSDFYSGTLAPPKKIQHILRDPLAIAAVTCCFAFLPSYSTNLFLTKSVGFFPEESRVESSFFSPWDMPAEVLASDMDFISSHHNLAEYPFFLPFYDKGEYGGWLGVGEEDIRYGPFRLWQTRRIRAPWRRTTLQEPALTYANDKSLFVNPNPNPRKEKSTSITLGQPLTNSPLSLPSQDNLPFFLSEMPKGDKEQKIQNSQEPKDLTSVTAAVPPPVADAKGDGDGEGEGVQPYKGAIGKNLGEPKDLTLLGRLPVAESDLSNNTITKNGRKRLIEGFKKPVRKMSTSKLFNLSSFQPKEPKELSEATDLEPKVQEYLRPSFINKESSKVQQNGFTAIPYRIGGFINTLSEKVTSQFRNYPSPKDKKGNKLSLPYGTSPTSELKIKNTKQIRKRFKKFKKRVRLFRNKSYKKRNTKIRRLKHFHYLRNKKKKRRKSRRLIYKLRRQFPYMRNIKKRKAEIFGLYSPYPLPEWNLSGRFLAEIAKGDHNSTSMEEINDQKIFRDSNPFAFSGEADKAGEAGKAHVNDESKIQNKNNEKSSYDRGYPKNKSLRNSKKDFNLIFRTQIGERLDFAQEEIRARIFMNPYIRFLLNKRIDNFLSREKPYLGFQGIKSKGKGFLSKGDTVQAQSAKLTADAEEKLFKRRLIISRYADAIDFLKPNSRHSYVDRIYNHQFKGTLSTARRLFSLKVQYDQPLVHPKNYKPVLEHEDFIKSQRVDLAFSNSKKTKNAPTEPSGQDSFGGGGGQIPVPLQMGGYPYALEPKGRKVEDSGKKSAPAKPYMEYDQGSLLEKSSTAPFYAAWDESSRKLVFTNRYLNSKLATRGLSRPESKTEKNHHQQFTSWPLREPYFKDNEFLVSQLYSNSQPIDSFLSQENEKARPVTLPRRVSSFNTVLGYKNSVPPTEAQRSQQLFKIENNDRKTFLFKHLWTTSATANTAASFKGQPSLASSQAENQSDRIIKDFRQNDFINKNKYKLPTSAEQKKTTRMEEREYPLWMVLRTLAPNQGGFLWPGD